MPRTRRQQRQQSKNKQIKEQQQSKQQDQQHQQTTDAGNQGNVDNANPIQQKDNEKVEKVEKKKKVTSKGKSKSKSTEKEAETSENEQDIKQPKKQKRVKKYTKKSVEQVSRINRSKFERIFLLSAERIQQNNNWQFVVQGTKGSHYKVKVSTEVHCTCTDFRIRRVPCKHIYFIVTQVGQNDELLDYFKNDKKISKKAFAILDEQLSNRLNARLKTAKDTKDIDLKDDKDCVICFSEMDKETEPLQDCPTCKKYFHAQCLQAWKNHNTSCPLCRGALSGGDRDPLGKLMDIKL